MAQRDEGFYTGLDQGIYQAIVKIDTFGIQVPPTIRLDGEPRR